MEYISRENAIEIVKSGRYWEREDMEVAVTCIEQTPTADVVEIKHGEWQRQKNGFYFVCSVCGKASATKGNFCHNCGAKMDGE